MVNIIPLSNSSDGWTITQDGSSRDLHATIDFAVKLAINSTSLKKEKLKINVHCCNDRKIQHLNNKIHGNALNNDETDKNDHSPVNTLIIKACDQSSDLNAQKFLGHIYICINRVKKEAANENKLFINYLYKNLINATLQLTERYDNANEINSAKLKKKEKEILEIIGIKSGDI